MIKLEKLSKKFLSVKALQNINIEFDQNRSITILGPSGSGKSTLLRCICQLEEITSGKIFLRGQEITQKNRYELGLKIGMVFQNFNLFPHFTVLKNLTYSAINVLKYSIQDANQKAEQLLSSFRLLDKCNELPNKLSGGQKQRVAICRALMMDPEIMLFDEPSSALDLESIYELVRMIENIKRNITVIIVTHQIDFAKKVADKIVFMDKGRVLSYQPTQEFFSKPKSHRARLFLQNFYRNEI